MAELTEKELDEILKDLPSNTKYNEFDNSVKEGDKSNDCNEISNYDESLKTLCDKFVKNIKALPKLSEEKDKHNDHYLYLYYWILDKIRKHFSMKGQVIDSSFVNKLVNIGNVVYRESNLRYFFYTSLFDFEWAKQQKHLHDYFKNCDKIISCSGTNCELYNKYVTYIDNFYDKHKYECFLDGDCDYFNSDKAYEPKFMLSKLKDKIQKGSVPNEHINSLPKIPKEDEPQESEHNISMVIKNIVCKEIKNEKDNVLYYNCEDPAYRQHIEKAVFTENSKDQKPSETTPFEIIQKIKNIKCEEVKNNYNQVVGHNCTKIDSSEQLQNEDSSEAVEQTVESKDTITGIKLLPLHREVAVLRYEDKESEEHSDSGYSTLTPEMSLFNEIPKKPYDAYVTEEEITCPNDKKKKALPGLCPRENAEDSKNDGIQSNSKFSPPGYISEEIDPSNSRANILNTFETTSFRIAISFVLIIGIFMVFLVYYKFTPFGSWLRRKILRRKNNNDSLYEYFNQDFPSDIPEMVNVNSNRRRVNLAYHSM
ncbi:PIR Superfamily Protein [Plasmodium ovale curtisi]|uniref:PIR Superfamily Protein n=1 Tax=Plasmodium ovale curtisi TaxID=864141 RepID=A0A1A8WJC1_PLAOA|nr:PIR Superfamily Protein [Plasmodium ovale curtisi]